MTIIEFLIVCMLVATGLITTGRINALNVRIDALEAAHPTITYEDEP